jgi:ankyrin repeat protein/peroxiredoxin
MRFFSLCLFILALNTFSLKAQFSVDPTRDLFYAIFDNNYAMAERALNQGANVHGSYTYERYADECRNWMPAYSAAAIGNLKILKLLKEKGADFNKLIGTPDTCQSSAALLHIAAGYGSNDIINYLIQDEKMPIDIQAADGRTPLFDAVVNGKFETVKFLLDKGANPNITAKVCTLKTVQTPIYAAVDQGRYDLLDILLSKGAKIEVEGTTEPLLIHALRSENLQAIVTLLEKGANPDVKDISAVSAKELAAKTENSFLIKLMETGTLNSRERKIMELLSNDAMKKFKLVNTKAPLIEFSNLNGTKVTSASFPGNLLIINVWATWCSPCIKEMPSFRELLKKMNRQDVKLLAVSLDEKLFKLKDFVAKNPYPFIFLHDPEANIRSIFDGVVPATYIINKKGELVAKVEGSTEWDKKEIRTFLEYLANEK